MEGKVLAAAALAVLLLAQVPIAHAQGPSNYQCRMAGEAANNGCGLPYALSNFQGTAAAGRVRESRGSSKPASPGDHVGVQVAGASAHPTHGNPPTRPHRRELCLRQLGQGCQAC